MSPNLNPSRMPCLTQVLTRQPVGDEASGSAARTEPFSRAAFSSLKAARPCARSAPAPAAASASMVDCRLMLGVHALQDIKLLQQGADLFLRRGAGRNHRQAVGLFAESHRR